MDNWQAQQAFWSSFGIPAYDDQTEFTEGDQPAYPHIKYESFSGRLGQTTTLSVHLWYRSNTWEDIKKKADEIGRYMAEHEPIALKLDKGYLRIMLPVNSVFAQPVSTGSDDELLKRIRLTVEVESLSNY